MHLLLVYISRWRGNAESDLQLNIDFRNFGGGDSQKHKPKVLRRSRKARLKFVRSSYQLSCDLISSRVLIELRERLIHEINRDSFYLFQRDRDTDRHRQTQTDRHRHRQTQRDTDRHRQTQTDTDRHKTDKDRKHRQDTYVRAAQPGPYTLLSFNLGGLSP